MLKANLAAQRVYAEYDPMNTPSWKLLEKAGLKREAHFKQNIWFHKDESGKPIWKDTYVYAITENDYEKVSKAALMRACT